MRWIALHLPLLSLESFAATLPAAQAAQALALMDQHQVVAANAEAQAAGVQAGMKRATALSLSPHLVLGRADELRDAEALTSVAHAALAYTPLVCLSPPDTVLLEVQASLRYFGGRDALVQRLLGTLAPLGHHVQCVSAPTAQGAALLSRVANQLHCDDAAHLQRALDQAPIELLQAGAAHHEKLLTMGLRRLGDLRRLPRSGLARRFSEALLEELDRALGHRPDPRQPLVLPPVFASQLELFARADTTEQVLHGAQILLARLVAWLSAQHAFVRRFDLRMKHEARWRDSSRAPPVTVLEVALAEPSRDAAHMLVLLRERLAALQLPAPTLELSLQADDISHQPPPNTELFPTPQSERAGLTRLIERLQARLGREQVQRLVPVADHRPERATEVQPADPLMVRSAPAAPASCNSGAPEPTVPAQPITRPLWLLPQPLALQERHARPLLDGQALLVLAGPERIESGWWDGGLAERDYFIAQTAEGALLWLYHARFPASDGTRAWFLQGRFA